MPAPARRSMWPLPPLRASAPMRSLSPPTDTSPAAASNLPPWRRATGFRRSYSTHEAVAAGGLMSYGTNFADTYRQVGVYKGSSAVAALDALVRGPNGSEFDYCSTWAVWLINHTRPKSLQ
jgi:hypothetical protein